MVNRLLCPTDLSNEDSSWRPCFIKANKEHETNKEGSGHGVRRNDPMNFQK